MAARLPIRAHHLLCLQGFQGRGYDDAFVAGMRSIAEAFRNDPELEFEIVAATDAICGPCPHRDGATCGKDKTAERRVRATDARVLEKTGLRVGETRNARALAEFVNAKLRSRADVADICGACPWLSDCLWYGSRAP